MKMFKSTNLNPLSSNNLVKKSPSILKEKVNTSDKNSLVKSTVIRRLVDKNRVGESNLARGVKN